MIRDDGCRVKTPCLLYCTPLPCVRCQVSRSRSTPVFFFFPTNGYETPYVPLNQVFNQFIPVGVASAPLRPGLGPFFLPRRPKTTNAEFRVLRHTQMCCSGEAAKQKSRTDDVPFPCFEGERNSGHGLASTSLSEMRAQVSSGLEETRSRRTDRPKSTYPGGSGNKKQKTKYHP